MAYGHGRAARSLLGSYPHPADSCSQPCCTQRAESYRRAGLRARRRCMGEPMYPHPAFPDCLTCIAWRCAEKIQWRQALRATCVGWWPAYRCGGSQGMVTSNVATTLFPFHWRCAPVPAETKRPEGRGRHVNSSLQASDCTGCVSGMVRPSAGRGLNYHSDGGRLQKKTCGLYLGLRVTT